MNEKKALEIMKNKLTKNGKFLILDIIKKNMLIDYFLSFTAIIPNFIMSLMKNGKVKLSPEEIEAWAEHEKYDKYLTINEIKNIAKEVLGKSKIKRHLFWRYSLIYKNGE